MRFVWRCEHPLQSCLAPRFGFLFGIGFVGIGISHDS